MRYKDSVEDRVHHLLSGRLQSNHRLFGQIPDVLEDVWIDVVLGQIENAKKTIDAIPEQHPFELRYDRIERVPWESCTSVLESHSRREHLLKGWQASPECGSRGMWRSWLRARRSKARGSHAGGKDRRRHRHCHCHARPYLSRHSGEQKCTTLPLTVRLMLVAAET